MRSRLLLLLIAASVLFPACLEDVEEVPLVTDEEGLQAPVSIRTVMGDSRIMLSWTGVDEAVSYRLYRSQTLGDEWTRIAQTADTSYTDQTVVNGIQYLYRVSSVSASGLESSWSEPVTAMPSNYSMMINGGLESTGSRVVELAMNAPASTAAMRLSNQADLAGAPWEVFAAVRSWMLTEGDGEKMVYVSFQDRSGATSPVFSASIELDTYAGIEGLDISPSPYIYAPGSTVHLALSVEDDETGGSALVEIEGLTAGPIVLNDDGRGGDETADDGVYEAGYTFPSNFRGTDLVVVASFTDMVGNEAAPLEWGSRISFTDPPEAVQLIGSIDSTTSMITIKWSESTESDFAAYRIYRDTKTGVTDSPALFVQGLDFQSQTTYPDSDLDQGVTYYYRVYVVNDLDESTGSNEISASTYDAVPVPVTLSAPTAVGTDRLTIEWTVNSDTDFGEYRVYRSTSPGVTESSQFITAITNRELTYFDDSGLDTAANTYYYRVMVYDTGGKSSRSNEVSTSTP
jgi:fibronectin type 3 domain-containing protein